MSDEKIIYRSPGVLGILGVAFVVLKLTGYIDWSWWWVTAPFWGPLALLVGLVLLILFIAGIAGIIGFAINGWKD